MTKLDDQIFNNLFPNYRIVNLISVSYAVVLILNMLYLGLYGNLNALIFLNFILNMTICLMLFLGSKSIKKSLQNKDLFLAKKGLNFIYYAVVIQVVIIVYNTFIDIPNVINFIRIKLGIW